MLFVIDIGNTHVTAGVYAKTKLVGQWRISSGVNRTSDELWFMLKMLLQNENIRFKDISGCALSSVVPDQTHSFVSMIEEHLQFSPVVVTSKSNTGLKILYDDPSSVGPDRICNSVAALNEFEGPLIIVDFGTATTFDVLSEKGEYLGGVIAPGLETSSFVLHHYAARLPKVELLFPKVVIGRTTETSMQAGIMYGIVDLVNGVVERINSELGKKSTLLVTGGIAPKLLPYLKNSPIFRPHLTLEGLRLIYQES